MDPFVLPVETGEQEEIIDIQSDKAAKIKHTQCCPINLWLVISSTYPTLAQNNISQLLVFANTWECEQSFSAMMSIKSKSRNHLTSTSNDFQCAVSTVARCINQLVQEKQMQPSH